MANRNQIQIDSTLNTVDITTTDNQVVIVQSEGTTINVSQPVTETVKIATLGPQGPVGPVGPQGPSGSTVITEPITNNVIVSGSLIATGSSDFKNGITVTGSILTTDNVGIGTNAPTQTLHVSSSTTDAVAKFQSSDTKAFIIIQDDGDAGFVGVQTDRLALGTNTNFTSTDNVYIKNDGNVGIGIISPSEKLHVVGNISASGFKGNGSALTGITLNTVLSAGNTARGANIFMGDGTGEVTANISEVNSLSAINITASTNISASGFISSSLFSGPGGGLTEITASNVTYIESSDDNEYQILFVTSSETTPAIRIDSQPAKLRYNPSENLFTTTRLRVGSIVTGSIVDGEHRGFQLEQTDVQFKNLGTGIDFQTSGSYDQNRIFLTGSPNQDNLEIIFSGRKGFNFLASSSIPQTNTILYITSSGNVGIGTKTPTSFLHVSGSAGTQFRIEKPFTPSATGDSTGATGDFSWDDNYIYVKTSAGWKRAALSTF